MSNNHRSSSAQDLSRADRLIFFASQNWLFFFAVLFGFYVFLPFFAPLFMKLGWEGVGRGIYTLYSFLCHQLPQRSYFLFGPNVSYSLSEIQAVWDYPLDFVHLRQFVGTPELGWKVAWSDRMVSMYVSTWLFGVVWWRVRRSIKALPWWGLILFLLPMALDGTTHLLSDMAGLGQGFRDSNAWLAGIPGSSLPITFYAGDGWGSFNAWMRLLTGLFFGLGIVWFGFPYLDQAFNDSVHGLTAKARLLAEWEQLQEENYQMLLSIAKQGKEG